MPIGILSLGLIAILIADAGSRIAFEWATTRSEAFFGGKFVVSRSGEAYDARDRGPNPKFRCMLP